MRKCANTGERIEGDIVTVKATFALEITITKTLPLGVEQLVSRPNVP